MCGIAGIISRKGEADGLTEYIRKMSSLMSHRGPDGEGFLHWDRETPTPYQESLRLEAKDPGLRYFPSGKPAGDKRTKVVFAHRRLSIIDLDVTGHQPMCDADGKIWITYNGEIYNYPELKAELSSLGHRFLSNSDTEVIINAYRQWGTACVERFNGMWAFMILDTGEKTCFASRDRLGVKPFYYLLNDRFLSFASEQKALVKSGLHKAAADPSALHDFLLNSRVEKGENNFFRGVKELMPGNNLIYSLTRDECSIRSYFIPSESRTNEHLTSGELVKQIRELLTRNVRMRLRSDVEVGTCLSGGLDSSVIAALMAEGGGKKIRTFSSVFPDQPFDEERYIRIMTDHISASSYFVTPDTDSFLKDLDDLVYSQDVPIWDSSTYSQYRVMRLAAENGIKVVLDGQGADELFGGYQHYYIAKWRGLLSAGKKAEAIKEMKASKRSISSPFLFFAKESVKAKHNTSVKGLSLIYERDFVNSGEVINPTVYFDSVNEQQLYDIREARLRAYLKCEDRCGMWHSVESRTPFSDDPELFSFMFSFDGNRKISDGWSKVLLRNAFSDILPASIAYRSDKRGFETPMSDWMLKALDEVNDAVTSMEKGILKVKEVSGDDMRSLKKARTFFRILVYHRWKKKFLSED